jgi:hypothetical protein
LLIERPSRLINVECEEPRLELDATQQKWLKKPEQKWLQQPEAEK